MNLRGVIAISGHMINYFMEMDFIAEINVFITAGLGDSPVIKTLGWTGVIAEFTTFA